MLLLVVVPPALSGSPDVDEELVLVLVVGAEVDEEEVGDEPT